MNRPTKAIIIGAGYGSRMLPVSKAVEKCMLPLLNRPVIDYLVQDCVEAGVKDIYFVLSPGSTQVRHYYSRDVELEAYLVAKGKQDMLPAVRPPEGVNFHYLEQDMSKYGTSVPVAACREFISDDESFMILYSDAALYTEGGGDFLRFVNDVSDANLDIGIYGVEVPREGIERYGVIDLDENHYFRGIVEKPSRDEAPSNLINSGFYILPGNILDRVVKQLENTVTGEYYLTDVVNEYVADGHPMYVYRSSAQFLDAGSVEEWVKSNQWLYERQLNA